MPPHPRCHRGIAYGHHRDVELERHPGEWVIGIDHHEFSSLTSVSSRHQDGSAIGLSATDAFGQSLPVADDNLRRLITFQARGALFQFCQPNRARGQQKNLAHCTNFRDLF